MRKANLGTYLFMVIPAFILFFVFHTAPATLGIFYSFTNYDGYSATYDFVGLFNYINVFKDDVVFDSYQFTFKFAIFATIIVNIISLILAVSLNSRIKFKNFFKALYFLPFILSMLIISYIFGHFFNNTYIEIMTSLGLDKWAFNPLGNEYAAWIAILFVTVWQGVAFNTILYLAGLQTIPADLYEASALDGASKWREFWSITFPLISAFFTINMVLSFKGFLGVFDQIIALTGGGPFGSTTSISVLIYKNGFTGSEYAFQSANAVIYFVIVIAISLIQLNYLQKREMNL